VPSALCYTFKKKRGNWAQNRRSRKNNPKATSFFTSSKRCAEISKEKMHNEHKTIAREGKGVQGGINTLSSTMGGGVKKKEARDWVGRMCTGKSASEKKILKGPGLVQETNQKSRALNSASDVSKNLLRYQQKWCI